ERDAPRWLDDRPTETSLDAQRDHAATVSRYDLIRSALVWTCSRKIAPFASRFDARANSTDSLGRASSRSRAWTTRSLPFPLPFFPPARMLIAKLRTIVQSVSS